MERTECIADPSPEMLAAGAAAIADADSRDTQLVQAWRAMDGVRRQEMAYLAAVHPPLEFLPREWWRAKMLDDRTVQLGIFGRRIAAPDRPIGSALAVYWLKWPLDAFPNPLVGIEDLEAMGVGPAFRAHVDRSVTQTG